MNYVEQIKRTYYSEMHEALVNCGQINNFESGDIEDLTFAYVIYSRSVERAFDEYGADWIAEHYTNYLVSPHNIFKAICPALDAQDEELNYAFVHRPTDILVFTNKPLSPAWFRIASGWRIAEIQSIPTLLDFVQCYQRPSFQ